MRENADVVDALANLALEQAFRVGVAESLTGGQLAAALSAGADAADWFRGGVVAYAADVKFDVLGVTPGPVVTAACAQEMALGANRLLDADAAVATTGVGGPDPEEGLPPGTVHVATLVRGEARTLRLELPGDPAEVLRQTRDRALDVLLDAMRSCSGGVSARPRPGSRRAGSPAG